MNTYMLLYSYIERYNYLYITNHPPLGLTLPIDGDRPDLCMGVTCAVGQAFNGQRQLKPRDDKLLSLSDGNKFVDKPAADTHIPGRSFTYYPACQGHTQPPLAGAWLSGRRETNVNALAALCIKSQKSPTFYTESTKYTKP